MNAPNQAATDAAHAYFALEVSDGIARLTLNRPERMNTMEPRFFPALRDTLHALSSSGEARVVVIASTGKHFSAGMALDVFGGDDALLTTRDARARLSFNASLRALIGCFSAIDEARLPVICAIQGGCIGGALDLATACDIRVCSADAFFTVQEIHIGMMADLGVLQRLIKIVPQGVAREMAYTGMRVTAERALQVGLVNAVLPDADATLAHALGLAREIAAKSPLAIAGSKLALNHARDHGTEASLQQMAWMQSAIFDTGELAQAIRAWKSKQAAQFDPLTPVAHV